MAPSSTLAVCSVTCSSLYEKLKSDRSSFGTINTRCERIPGANYYDAKASSEEWLLAQDYDSSEESDEQM